MFTHINFEITSVKSWLSFLIIDHFSWILTAAAGRRKIRNLGKEIAGFVSLRRMYLEENIDVDGGYCVLTIRWFCTTNVAYV